MSEDQRKQIYGEVLKEVMCINDDLCDFFDARKEDHRLVIPAIVNLLANLIETRINFTKESEDEIKKSINRVVKIGREIMNGITIERENEAKQ